ncbi:MAG: AarF/UbiB family protein [Imperialibacter sp.]|uniref:ABC1 kinase family protein n=1 Tax=Imperialibacter sp. TaxID=2038411 RepID=UPI0032EEEA24
MKEQSSIPTSKVERASKFVKTGAKVGGNYVKHYAKRFITGDASRENLDQANAEDIYGSLSELKGSALKVAQMLAMDKNILPTAYQNQFSMAQYSAPPLSYPLVVKTFKEQLGKLPTEAFESFTKSAVNAASIGQVHKGTIGDREFAVKVQYPGVAGSVRSDLKLVKPFALRLVKLNEQELDHYMEEVEERLLEETDYKLELLRSQQISDACAHIPNLTFPRYYSELSSERILTMDWLQGLHLKEFLKTNPSQNLRNQIGQAMWDFYNHQVHNLLQVHADPHPGNFLMMENGRLGVIDFGCVKVIPEDFYRTYFQLMREDLLWKEEELVAAFHDLCFLYEDDPADYKILYIDIFKQMMQLLGAPFHKESFDFANEEYFKKIFDLGEGISKRKEFKNSKHPRGSRHGLYINRTYFGLYNLLHDLGAEVKTTKPEWLEAEVA